MKSKLGCAAIILVYLMCGTNLYAKKYIRKARIKQTQGIVRIWHDKEKIWKSPEPEINFYPRDQIMTEADSSVTIFFQDRSEVLIHSNSLVRVDELLVEKSTEAVKVDLKKSTIFTVWLGKIRATVSPITAHDTFEINTPVATCAVRGTDFSVAVNEHNETVVKVYEGVVGVKDTAGLGEEKLVYQGSQVIVKPGAAVPDPEPLVDEEAPVSAPTALPEPVPSEPEPIADVKPVREKPEPAPAAIGATEYRLGKWVKLTMSGSLGAAVLTDPSTGENKVFYKIALMPELAVWKFGVGFDFFFYYDEESNLRKEDWDNPGDIIKKIWYVRFGEKHEPIYAYLGGLKSATIGHGLIMNNYSNMLRYPDVRTIGARLSLNFKSWGLESMVADINQAEIIGGRVFVRPLYKSALPLINRIAVGISGVTDQDPDSDDDTLDDAVSVYGIDAELPVFSSNYFSAMIFGDAAQMDLGDIYTVQGSSDEGKGYTAGVMGRIFSIQYRAEYRKFEQNFVPSYFDAYYDRDRYNSVTGIGKADLIAHDTDPIREGPYASLGIDLFSMVKLTASYEDYSRDTQMAYPFVHGELTVDPRLFLNKFTFKGSYDKRNVHTWDDIQDAAGAIITAEIGYSIAPHIMMVMIQRQTFDAQGDSTKTMEIETRIQF